MSGRPKLSIEHAQAQGEARNIDCLSSEYVRKIDPLDWRCRTCDYKWSISLHGLEKTKHGCPKCAKTVITIEDIDEVCARRGGRWLTSTYTNNSAHMEFECARGHKFKKSWSHVQQGQWCTYCSKRVRENACRQILEDAFGSSFPTLRPKWLMGAEGKPLELDGYSETTGLAFEHHGLQHYERVKKWHTHEEYALLQERDRETIKGCDERGVKLIVVPYKVPFGKELEVFLFERCRELGFDVPRDVFKLNIDRVHHMNSGQMNTLRGIAEDNGFEILEEVYVNQKYPMSCQCLSCAHKWRSSATAIKNQRSACPKCANQRRSEKVYENHLLRNPYLSMEGMHRLAEERKEPVPEICTVR